MKVLGINTSHDPSIALCEDGKITQYYEEVRFKKIKYWEPSDQIPFRFECLDKIDISQVDVVAYSIYGPERLKVVNTLQTQLGHPTHYANPRHHHMYHATCSAYFSSFDDAMCIVIDGGGARFNEDYETESIYYINKKQRVLDCKYMHLSDGHKAIVPAEQDYHAMYETLPERFKAIQVNKPVTFSSLPGPGKFFDGICLKFFGSDKVAGKLMGLASYSIDEPKLAPLRDAIDLGKKAQQYLLDTTCHLIERAMSYNQTKNFVLSGGCALNCVNNFKLVKLYPNLNFAICPIGHDGSQAVGAAIYYHDYHK